VREKRKTNLEGEKESELPRVGRSVGGGGISPVQGLVYFPSSSSSSCATA
jgi:hypothetical protein